MRSCSTQQTNLRLTRRQLTRFLGLIPETGMLNGQVCQSSKEARCAQCSRMRTLATKITASALNAPCNNNTVYNQVVYSSVSSSASSFLCALPADHFSGLRLLAALRALASARTRCSSCCINAPIQHTSNDIHISRFIQMLFGRECALLLAGQLAGIFVGFTVQTLVKLKHNKTNQTICYDYAGTTALEKASDVPFPSKLSKCQRQQASPLSFPLSRCLRYPLVSVEQNPHTYEHKQTACAALQRQLVIHRNGRKQAFSHG